MQAALRLKAQILPGKRVEFTAPELPERGEVELIVVFPDQEDPTDEPLRSFASAQEYLDSLPPLPRSAEEWAQVEREFATERDAWER
jgi:hypothetical protein